MGSTLIYYQRVPTDGARRLGCAGFLELCCRLPASGLLRPEARWPDKVLFSAEKSGALRANAASRLRPAGRGWNGLGGSGGAALRPRRNEIEKLSIFILLFPKRAVIINPVDAAVVHR